MLSRFRRWELPLQDARLRLARATPGGGIAFSDLVDPFLTLSDRGTYSRTILADVVGPAGDSILPVVIKLQSDEYPLVVASGVPRITNRDVEESWQLEIEIAERCGPTDSGIPPIVEVLERERGHAAVLPPTLYCKQTDAFFVAPCPDCGGPLSDLRDEALLESRDLPSYDRSAERFLGCQACEEAGKEPRLWTLVKDPDSDVAELGDQSDLVRSYAALATAETPPGRSVLPCQGCDHVSRCHPAGGAAGDAHRYLTSFTFYEARCVAMPLYHLRYDEFVALLGGATIEEVAGGITEAGRLAALMRVQGHLAESPGYLFAHDMAGKLALEVLRLKLSVFRELCQGVAALHRYGKVPHLGIAPSRALVRLDGVNRGQPALWNFAVGLAGVGNARMRSFRVGRAKDLPAPPFQRPPRFDAVFAAPALLEAERTDVPCTLTFSSIQESSEGQVVITASIESDAIDLNRVEPRDAITVSVVQARPPLSLSLLGHPLGTVRGALRLKSVPFSLGEQGRRQVEQLIDQQLTRARISLFPCLHVPCDVHSLGMTLLATLLANEDQPPGEVGKAAVRVADLLESFAGQQPAAGLAEIAAQAGQLLQAEAMADVFDRRHLFHNPKRRPAAAMALPQSLWHEAIVLGLRAATRIRGFSVCRSFADFDPAHPEVNVEFFLQLVDSLIRRIDERLFGLPGRAREIRAALARVSAATDADSDDPELDDRTRIAPMR